MNLGGIAALPEFIESHHCKRVTLVHLELAHLIIIILMIMMMIILIIMMMIIMMMMKMMTVNSDALWGKTSTKR